MTVEADARGLEGNMIDIQKVLVADRIQQLERDATPQAGRRRAPRAFDRGPDIGGRLLVATSLRLRLGRLLVNVGEAIAGSPVAPADDAPNTIPNAA
jgi:hypothetical protein